MIAVESLVFPKEMAVDFTPLRPEMGLGEPADEALYSLADHGFVAALGVQPAHLGELAAMAHQTHIAEFCANDVGRFGDEDKVRTWLRKGRLQVGIYDVRQPKISLDEISDIGTKDVTQTVNSWLGYEPNNHVPGADLTTAWRVSAEGRVLARARRHSPEDGFKLGLPAGRLVVGIATNWYGVPPQQVSLETWKSNEANKLYDILGFVQPEGVEPKQDVRPTLQPVGTEIGEHVVYFDQKKGNNMVTDYRLFKILGSAAV